MNATRPDAPTEASGVVRSKVARLKIRRDFLAVAGGGRYHMSAFSLQGRRRAETEPCGGTRVGFTVTRKVGTATERNRIRRRLREAIRTMPDLPLRDDHDYVLVGRREALSVSFGQIVADLKLALAHLHTRDGKNRHRADRRSSDRL